MPIYLKTLSDNRIMSELSNIYFLQLNDSAFFDKQSIIITDIIEVMHKARVSRIPAIYCGESAKTLLGNQFLVAHNTEEIATLISVIGICQKILEVNNKKKGKYLGINGVDTSGKTQFTRTFTQFCSYMNIPFSLIKGDDYRNPMTVLQTRIDKGDLVGAFYIDNFNYQRMVDEILNPYREQGSLQYVFDTIDADHEDVHKPVLYNIGRDDIVIIEGVLLFRSPLNEWFDTRVFFDVSWDEMKRRAVVRDSSLLGDSEKVIWHYNNVLIPGQKRYFEEWDPLAQSDLVINNEDYRKPYISLNKAMSKTETKVIESEREI